MVKGKGIRRRWTRRDDQVYLEEGSHAHQAEALAEHVVADSIPLPRQEGLNVVAQPNPAHQAGTLAANKLRMKHLVRSMDSVDDQGGHKVEEYQHRYLT